MIGNEIMLLIVHLDHIHFCHKKIWETQTDK